MKYDEDVEGKVYFDYGPWSCPVLAMMRKWFGSLKTAAACRRTANRMAELSDDQKQKVFEQVQAKFPDVTHEKVCELLGEWEKVLGSCEGENTLTVIAGG